MLPKTYQREEAPKKDLPSQYTMSHLKKDKDKVKFRCLTDFIEGREVFGLKDGKDYPYRVTAGTSMPVEYIGVNKFNGYSNIPHQFIAAIVWSYTNSQVEIFLTTREDIKDAIEAMEKDEDWKDCKDFDVSITRKGTGTDTAYQTLPSNKNPYVGDKNIQGIDLNELFVIGGNPFKNYKRPIAEVSDPADDFEAFTRRAT